MRILTRKIEDWVDLEEGSTVEAPKGELVIEASNGSKIRIQEEDGVFQISCSSGRLVLYPAVSNMVYLKIERHK